MKFIRLAENKSLENTIYSFLISLIKLLYNNPINILGNKEIQEEIDFTEQIIKNYLSKLFNRKINITVDKFGDKIYSTFPMTKQSSDSCELVIGLKALQTNNKSETLSDIAGALESLVYYYKHKNEIINSRNVDYHMLNSSLASNAAKIISELDSSKSLQDFLKNPSMYDNSLTKFLQINSDTFNKIINSFTIDEKFKNKLTQLVVEKLSTRHASNILKTKEIFAARPIQLRLSAWIIGNKIVDLGDSSHIDVGVRDLLTDIYQIPQDKIQEFVFLTDMMNPQKNRQFVKLAQEYNLPKDIINIISTMDFDELYNYFVKKLGWIRLSSRYIIVPEINSSVLSRLSSFFRNFTINYPAYGTDDDDYDIMDLGNSQIYYSVNRTALEKGTVGSAIKANFYS